MLRANSCKRCTGQALNVCLLPCLCCSTALLAGRYASAVVGARITPVCAANYYCPGGVPDGAFNFTAAYDAEAETTIVLCFANSVSSAGATAESCLAAAILTQCYSYPHQFKTCH